MARSAVLAAVLGLLVSAPARAVPDLPGDFLLPSADSVVWAWPFTVTEVRRGYPSDPYPDVHPDLEPGRRGWIWVALDPDDLVQTSEARFALGNQLWSWWAETETGETERDVGGYPDAFSRITIENGAERDRITFVFTPDFGSTSLDFLEVVDPTGTAFPEGFQAASFPEHARTLDPSRFVEGAFSATDELGRGFEGAISPPIPEPSSWPAYALGAAAVAVFGRRIGWGTRGP